MEWIDVNQQSPNEYQTVIISVKTTDGRSWTMPSNYQDQKFVECTTNDEFLQISQDEIYYWMALPSVKV
ncbi:hypothetical protein [Arenibacter sp. S6351L]|uniref:hypothetical protein n=1 Tax=Arenibacter sp. S6351L TaxID=2926407 RepID=UPI001FF18923|nr:hypothetical protein [Arenibacter sp. S6351L]MCK0137435.1 hypothetical protein [Arenibacter sp. S6351L]